MVNQVQMLQKAPDSEGINGEPRRYRRKQPQHSEKINGEPVTDTGKKSNQRLEGINGGNEKYAEKQPTF
jgi:hypothetical protein